MTRLQFRLLAFVAFSLFIAFAISGSGPGTADTKPISELVGPNTPADPSLLIPIVLLAAALGILVGYIGIFFLVRWARLTVILSTVAMVIVQMMIPSHTRPGGLWPLFGLAFGVASLAVSVVSFSVASALFQKKPQAGAD